MGKTVSHKYYMAIDIGTTNWKVSIFDETGQMAAIERCPTITHTDGSGNSYYDPEEMWDAVKRLMQRILKKCQVAIAAISVASVAEAVVPVDGRGRPIDNIITWFDTRSIREAQELEELLGSKKLFSITGLDVNPIFSLPKIMWVRRERPGIYEAAVKWLQMADFILCRLTGRLCTDYTLACRTLAFDIMQNDWSDEILKAVDMDWNIFPEILESGTVAGPVLPEVCEETGLNVFTKAVVGGHDHPVASIAVGAAGGNKVLDSSGTAEAYLYVSGKGRSPLMQFKGQRTGRYLTKDRYVLWGGIIASGRSFDWARSLFASVEALGLKQEEAAFEKILPAIKEVKGIEKGLIYYPHLRGAGAPYWNPRARGAFLGIRDTMDNRHFLRATLEGLCMQSRMIVEMHEAVSGTEIENICVVGGSSQNRLWQQLKANITQKNVELCFEPEATSFGAAALCAVGDGMYRDIEEVCSALTKSNEIIVPEKGMEEIYDPFYEIYKKGYDALRGIDEELYALIAG